jgi:hypothetical protein
LGCAWFRISARSRFSVAICLNTSVAIWSFEVKLDGAWFWISVHSRQVWRRCLLGHSQCCVGIRAHIALRLVLDKCTLMPSLTSQFARQHPASLRRTNPFGLFLDTLRTRSIYLWIVFVDHDDNLGCKYQCRAGIYTCDKRLATFWLYSLLRNFFYDLIRSIIRSM